MIAKHRIAVLLADAARAVALADRLERQGAGAVVATGTDELYQAFHRSPIDLVVIEQQLAGFLTGLEVLERLFGDLLRPASLLVGELSKEEVQRAQTIGVQCVLPASSTPEQIAAAVPPLLGPGQNTEVVLAAPARKVVQQADYIKPLPQLLVKLVGHLQSDDIDAQQLARDISVDPLLSADLLKYVNSSAVGRRQQTTKVSDALSCLGPRKAVGLVVSTGMMRARSSLLGDLPPLVHQWHSARAVLTACTAAAFAGRLEKISGESTYLLGLIQDLGVLVMARAFGEKYVETLLRVQRIPQLHLAHVEQDCYGVMHAEVSAALLCKWEFPASLVSLVLRHHDRHPQQHAAADLRFLRAMQIGEAMGDLHDNRSPQRYFALKKHLDHYGPEAAETCKACLAEAVAKTVESSEVFSIPAPSPQALQTVLSDVARQEWFRELRQDEETIPEETPPPPERCPALTLDPAEASPQILVIDDDPTIAKTIRLYLREWDCRALWCGHPADARRLAPQTSMILCEAEVGGESGAQVVRQLRAAGYTGPIVVISADNRRTTVMECLRAGVNDYLLKPFSKVQLINKLRAHLR